MPPKRLGAASLIAAGIFMSRVFGLVRQRVTAHYLGTSLAADALAAAFRIPNLLQNLFGEGVLSASFIPVYARLTAEGKRKEAGEVAGAVFSLLALAVAVIVLLGVLLAPWLVLAIAGGFDPETRELTTKLVRIIFPGIGLLVLSAWCLGILNSHKRFFLSYVSPVVWNVAIIAALIIYGGDASVSYLGSAFGSELVVVVAWASVLGSGLQFAVQIPTVWRLDRELRFSPTPISADVRTVVKNFFTVFAGRGVTQISAFIDALIASFMGAGALATLAYSQTISMLPVSLFGMSVSAAELPAMSGERGTSDEIARAIRGRLDRGLERIAYFVIPSAVAFVLIGDVLAAGLYQSGAFSAADVRWVWGALAGAAIGVVSGTQGRLYASASYAMGDARTPLRFALVRVIVGGTLGWSAALFLPARLGIDPRWGVAALTAASGVAATIEFYLLRGAIRKRVGTTGISSRVLWRITFAALAAGGAGFFGARLGGSLHPVFVATIAVSVFGAVYFVATRLLGADNARRS